MSSQPPGTPDFFSTDIAADTAMTYFYGRLFAAEPEIRAMFPAAMDGQRRRLYSALCRVAAGMPGDEPGGGPGIESYLARLGRGHRKFGVRPEHYGPFAEALEATFLRYPPDAGRWTELERTAAIRRAVEIMTSAAGADSGPAWWTAEVVSRELRAPGVAVLALRPGQRYPYLPGQHASVQTPHWPRVWRRYSIANAPGDPGSGDGLLTLHIRVVPGGLVSTAMRRACAGDTVLLGPAEGSMTARVDSPRDALCLAGGTGLAPVKAVAEALLARPGRRVTLYFGARTEADLYDLPALRAMERDHPSLTVRAATSEERVPRALHGTIAGLAADGLAAGGQAPGAGDAGRRDVYISGPDAMIDAAVRRLAALGVPPERLHYDPPPA